MELSIEIILMLAAVAAVAGFVDSIAGGGGLLTVPAMLIAGMDPVSTLATNKLQGTFGVGAASLQYVRHGAADWRASRGMMAVSFVAAMLGALFVASVPVDQLKAALPVVLLVLALYFLLSPRASDVEVAPRMSQPVFTGTVVPAIAFYDGAVGPATGSFFTLGFITLRGLPVLRATGTTKLLNFASNVGSLVLFAAAGKPVWLIGVTMAIGSVLGARLGSSLAIAKGAAVIKPVLVLACCAMAIKLLSDPAHPLWSWF
jgi:uncharacterized membrane protein YfcA